MYNLQHNPWVSMYIEWITINEIIYNLWRKNYD